MPTLLNNEREDGAHVVVVGLGNIGSSLVKQIARLPRVGAITLIDHDSYDFSNILTQDIRPEDVGHSKVIVQKRVLESIQPALQINAIAERVEWVPWGLFQSNIILAAVDSRRARMEISKIAWRLGVPLIDSGIHKDEMLARISAYKPSDHNPCLECVWNEGDYQAVEQRYPCGSESESPITNAPHCLGALAASLQALELRKLLENEYAGFSKEILCNANSCKQYLTKLEKNPACRFDHGTLPDIKRLSISPGRMTLGSMLYQVQSQIGLPPPVSLAVSGQSVNRIMLCSKCGETRKTLRLEPRLTRFPFECPSCGSPMAAPGFFESEALDLRDLSAEELGEPIASMGLLPGDIIQVTCADLMKTWVVIDGDSE